MSLFYPLLCRPISSPHPPFLHRHRPSRFLQFPLPSVKTPCSSPTLPLGTTTNLRLRFLTRQSANEGGPLDAGSLASSDEGGAEETAARQQSTLPSRFRHLTKEVPDRPVRWPWLIVVFFLVYAWRMVLWELSNWKKAAFAIAGFVGYLLKLVLAFIYHFIGDYITALIRVVETFLYSIHSVYDGIVGYVPVGDLTMIILLTSTVFATAEAAAPNSVKSQPYLLTLAGVFAYCAVDGSIPALLFWLLLSGLFCFSQFVKKRDNVTAALPVATAAAAVGEPWVRGIAIILYLALAMIQHSKALEVKAVMETDKKEKNSTKLPIPLLFAGLSIGIHLAAKWIRYRHLTWKAL